MPAVTSCSVTPPGVVIRWVLIWRLQRQDESWLCPIASLLLSLFLAFSLYWSLSACLRCPLSLVRLWPLTTSVVKAPKEKYIILIILHLTCGFKVSRGVDESLHQQL